MKVIISNGKRAQIYSNQLELNQLLNFTAQQFPRWKHSKLSFKDLQGNLKIISQSQDIQVLKKIYLGQNFVELYLTKTNKQGKEVKEGQEKKHQENHELKRGNRRKRRTHVLSKVFGGQPTNFQQFEDQNKSLSLGKLIKKYGQVNQITEIKFQHKQALCMEKKNKIFKRIFGESDYQQFFEQNKDLRLGQLIRKYSQINGKEKEINEKKRERKLEKLSKIFGKSKEELAPLIEQSSQIRLGQLIKILREKGVQADQTKLKQFKQEKRKNKQIKREDKQNAEQKQQSKSKSKGKKSKEKKKKNELEKITQSMQTKTEEIKDNGKERKESKGQILKQMKQLFGKENTKYYVQFINENYHLGQVGIIEKWFDNSSK